MKVEEIDKMVHEISSLGQSFSSYAHLLENPSINISHKKLQEICRKCAKNCMEIRQVVLIKEVKNV